MTAGKWNWQSCSGLEEIAAGNKSCVFPISALSHAKQHLLVPRFLQDNLHLDLSRLFSCYKVHVENFSLPALARGLLFCVIWSTCSAVCTPRAEITARWNVIVISFGFWLFCFFIFTSFVFVCWFNWLHCSSFLTEDSVNLPASQRQLHFNNKFGLALCGP